MNDAKRAGENAESKPLNLRLPHAVSDQLQALADSLPIVSKHRLAVEALRLGLAALAADPSILLRGASTPSTPSTSAPAAPAAPAPMRPVVSRVEAVEPPAAAPVDPRQLPLLAPVAPVALHRTADGSSVASRIGNDNAQEPTTPKRTRRAAPVSSLDTAAVAARLRAQGADEIARGVPKADRQWSYSRVAERVGLSKALIGKLGNGESVSSAAVAKVAAILPPA